MSGSGEAHGKTNETIESGPARAARAAREARAPHDASDANQAGDVQGARAAGDANDRTRRAFALDDAVRLLARTPGTLDAMLGGLPHEWTHAHEGGVTWSPFDVVGHLIHGELTDWLPRARIILEFGEARTFDKYDRFAQDRASVGKTLPDLLREFARLRSESVRELQALELTDTDLDRLGSHPEFGPVTLRQLLATWVAHDMDHIVQVARILANQYADEVGPWRAYLRVISGQPG
jgi:hypothetical protein